MSRPRVSRTVAGTRARSSSALNAAIRSREEPSYKHPDPVANTTTRGTRRKRARSNRYRDENGRRLWADEQLERAWPPIVAAPARSDDEH